MDRDETFFERNYIDKSGFRKGYSSGEKIL